jgi:ArsR family transcriptional regulator, arsenate/arsenite/antimonite-responsive transcriptional repressor
LSTRGGSCRDRVSLNRGFTVPPRESEDLRHRLLTETRSISPPPLTTIRCFDIHGNVKVIQRLPMTQLAASEEHVEAFKALAHLSRLEIFFFLVRAGREMSAGEIQAAVEIPGPTLSHHLDLLRRAGLIESRKEERYIYYSVQRERVTALVRLLTACC